MEKTLAKFIDERNKRILNYEKAKSWKKNSKKWIVKAFRKKFMYNFHWMGRPIIQIPNDIIILQELIYEINPDLIIETGIAHGGSLIFSASCLALLDLQEALKGNKKYNPNQTKRLVVGIDIDIRSHNLKAIRQHPMHYLIKTIKGSSTDISTIKKIRQIAANFRKILVFLDSNHTYSHVLRELEHYAPLVSNGSYCVVFDTIVSQMPKRLFFNRPWGPADNPKMAIEVYLKKDKTFKVDKLKSLKAVISACPGGFLKKVK